METLYKFLLLAGSGFVLGFTGSYGWNLALQLF